MPSLVTGARAFLRQRGAGLRQCVLRTRTGRSARGPFSDHTYSPCLESARRVQVPCWTASRYGTTG